MNEEDLERIGDLIYELAVSMRNNYRLGWALKPLGYDKRKEKNKNE